MATVKSFKEIQTVEEADGSITQTTTEKTTRVERTTEPDYIKLYTKMWCEFNQIPLVWRELFLQLVVRMTYCKIAGRGENSGECGGQLVSTGKPWGDDICRALGWKVGSKTNNQLMQGLRELCKCGAIKKINRGVYQINPQYAGKGEWKYNPQAQRGGVENLIATFNFATGSVNTTLEWADDGTNDPYNTPFRAALGVKPGEQATIVETTTKPPIDMAAELEQMMAAEQTQEG